MGSGRPHVAALVALIGACVTAVAAIGAGASTVASTDPSVYVLKLGDLPSGFKVSSARRSSELFPAGTQRGRIAGYLVQFVRSVSDAGGDLPGVAWVASAASVYRTAADAAATMKRPNNSCPSKPSKRLPDGSSLGDRVFLCSVVRRESGLAGHLYMLLWQHGRIRAITWILGLEGVVLIDEAVALARKQ